VITGGKPNVVTRQMLVNGNIIVVAEANW